MLTKCLWFWGHDDTTMQARSWGGSQSEDALGLHEHGDIFFQGGLLEPQKGLSFSQSFLFTYVTCLWIIGVGIMWITRTCKFRMRLKQLLLYFRQTWCTKTFMITSMWMTDKTSVDSYIGPWTLHRWCLDSPHMLTQVGHFQWQSRFPLYLHGISFRILSLELSSPDSFNNQLVYPRLYVATEGLCIIALGPVSSALHYDRYLRYSAHREKKVMYSVS